MFFERTALSLAYALAIASSGCVSVDEFRCEGDSECSGGVCERDGFCAFVDTNCTSGRRYGERSGPSSNECVDESNLVTATFSRRTGDHLGGVIDTVLKSDSPTMSFGSDPDLGCQSGNETYVSLFQFDLSAVPTDAIVVRAELELTLSAMTAGPRNVDVHAVSEQWSAMMASFNQRSSGVPWTNVGCGEPDSRATEAIGTEPVETATLRTARIDLDATAIQAWVTQPQDNRGLAFVCRDLIGNEGVLTSSSEGQDPRRPLLRVTYDPSR